MTDKTLERIEDDARKYAKTHSSAPDKETPTWIITDFTAGAKSERNKVLDEVSAKLNSLVEFGFVDVPWTEVTKILESLKL